MKTRLILIIILLTLPSISQAAPVKPCAPPYEPSNVIEGTLRYSESMSYIAEAPRQCSQQFADQFIEVFKESWLVSDGCLEVTIQDVEEALARRSGAFPTQIKI